MRRSASRAELKFGWVDVLRHLLALAVIFQHMPSQSRYPDAFNSLISDWSMYIDGAVACFFLISGFFSTATMSLAKIRKRAVRILVPYLVFCGIYAVVLSGMGRMSAEEALVRTFTFSGVGPQLYFLPYLFIVSVLFDILIMNIGRFGIAVLLIACACIYASLPTAISTGPSYRLFALYSTAYVYGVYRSRYAHKFENYFVILIGFVGILYFNYHVRYFDFALVLLAFECVMLLSIFCPLQTRLPGSGGVYLLHTPILNFAISAMLMRVGVGGFSNLFVTVVMTYAFALFCTLLALKIFPQWRWVLLE